MMSPFGCDPDTSSYVLPDWVDSAQADVSLTQAPMSALRSVRSH